MKHLYTILILSILTIPLFGQTPFICTGDFYITLAPNNASNSFAYSVTVDTSNNVNFTQIGNSDIGVVINAVGYRSTDNFIYGIDYPNADLYKIDATGTASFVDSLINMNLNNRFSSGDVTPDGHYLVILESELNPGLNYLKNLVKIDLTSSTYTQTSIPLTRLSTGNPNDSIMASDMAFDPINGELYSFNQNLHQLIKIDINTGVIDDVTYSPTNTIWMLGAMMFDPFGDLYCYGKEVNTPIQDKFFFINKQTGHGTVLASGPTASWNDGCSCPYTIRVLKTVSKETVAQCDTFSFELLIANTSGVVQTNVNIYDSLSNDFQIIQINNPLSATVNGLGTNILSFTNVTIPLGITRIEVKVQTNQNTLGTLASQTKITGLPLALGGTIYSDNPKTVATNDPTTVSVIPNIEQGSNATICADSLNVVLIPGANYLWSNGDTTYAINIDSVGTYFVSVEFFGCTITDTINVLNPLTLDLGNDTIICKNNDFLIQSNAQNVDFQWNTGDTTPDLLIHTEGWYSLEIIDTNKCITTDSIFITLATSDLELGNDTLICENTTWQIDLSDLNVVNYFWQDGSDNATYSTETEGQYSVTIIDNYTCQFSDTINISVAPSPSEILYLPTDTTICNKNFITVKAFSPNATAYLWEGESAFYQQNDATDTTFIITYPGTYQVTASNRCGGITQFLEVSETDCGCYPFVPNAFTPNNDGRNEVFQIFANCILQDFEMRIYDRWGNQVYFSNNTNEGWDGTFKGQHLPTAVYIWQIHFTTFDERGILKTQVLNGDVSLIK